MRNHPATSMINNGVKLVLSNDDPMLLGSGGVSFDWFYAIYSWDVELSSFK